jgi:hypothetical protein
MDGAGQLPAAHRALVSGCEGEGDITVSLVFGYVAAIVTERALRALWVDRPRREDCSLEELWHAKERKLNIPLSAQGHPVGQRGEHTGVAIDTYTCRGALSGIMIDGFVFRFAACQFGQKTASSRLGSLVRAVPRFFARLTEPVHVDSRVDDLIFIMSTPDHGERVDFEGTCAVCAEYHGRALKV